VRRLAKHAVCWRNRVGFSCLILLALAQLERLRAQTTPESYPGSTTTNFLDWSTNGPAIFQVFQLSATNSSPTNSALFRLQHRNWVSTNLNFSSFVPDSLSHAVWTNFLAHTNGRELKIWSGHRYPAGYPTNAPVIAWNTNGLMWGMRGLTGLSPCWEPDLGTGHAPITALTRRHGYTRGHGMGLEGFTTNRIGLKVWFLTADNSLVEVKIKQSVVRTRANGNGDYTIVLFDWDLPPSIQSLRVTTFTEIQSKYPFPTQSAVPHPIFMTEQGGRVSSSVFPLVVDVVKGGDSGCPNLLPMPAELVFFGGRSTTGPTPEMQADMDALCRMEKLDPRKYQLQWVDLSKFPSY